MLETNARGERWMDFQIFHKSDRACVASSVVKMGRKLLTTVYSKAEQTKFCCRRKEGVASPGYWGRNGEINHFALGGRLRLASWPYWRDTQGIEAAVTRLNGIKFELLYRAAKWTILGVD